MPIRRPLPATASAPARRPIRNSTANVSPHNGESFDPDIVTAASQPMLCGRSASEYRAYLPRARWIRDANDSYFAAMTYPQGLPSSHAAVRHPRCDLGNSVGGLWRRGASDAPKATPRWRTRHCRLRPRCCSSMPPCRKVISQPVPPIPLAPRRRGHRRDGGLHRRRAPLRERRSSSPRGRRLLIGRGGFTAAACAGRYFATMAGSTCGHRGIRQARPGLILAEQRDAEIAAHRQRLSVGADASSWPCRSCRRADRARCRSRISIRRASCRG